jgi:hypothetical protein
MRGSRRIAKRRRRNTAGQCGRVAPFQIDFCLSGTRRNSVGCRICFVFQALIGAVQKFFTGDLQIGAISPAFAAVPPELGS